MLAEQDDRPVPSTENMVPLLPSSLHYHSCFLSIPLNIILSPPLMLFFPSSLFFYLFSISWCSMPPPPPFMFHIFFPPHFSSCLFLNLLFSLVSHHSIARLSSRHSPFFPFPPASLCFPFPVLIHFLCSGRTIHPSVLPLSIHSSLHSVRPLSVFRLTPLTSTFSSFPTLPIGRAHV